MTVQAQAAAEKAAEALDQAAEHAYDAARSAALVAVADGWTRLFAAMSMSGTFSGLDSYNL